MTWRVQYSIIVMFLLMGIASIVSVFVLSLMAFKSILVALGYTLGYVIFAYGLGYFVVRMLEWRLGEPIEPWE